ncbi:MAG: hypothetical protein GNW80_11760 [Asgard group archaeon]|nr:hypothetical protein [Asgard group archaeon]
MKKKQILKFSVLVLFILFSNLQIISKNENHSNTTTSTSPVTKITPNNGPADWLLMFYLDGDHQYEHAIIDALNELEVGYILTGEVEVLIMVDRHNEYDKSASNWNGTRYYRLLPDSDPMIIGSELLLDLGEVNMGDGATLRNFVVWAQGLASAEKQALIILDHGEGLTGISWDFTSDRDYITPNELQEAMNGLHVDLLVTEACRMGYVEVAYEWRTFTDYIAFSQNTMLIESLDYDAVISELCLDPTIMPWELGEIFGTTYLGLYAYCTFQTFSVINCTLLASLVEALSNLSLELIDMLPGDILNLSAIRYESDEFSLRSVDIGTMIEVFQVEFQDNLVVKNILDEFETIYEEAILYNFNSPYSLNKTGMSLFFPIDNRTISPWEQYVNYTHPGDLTNLDFLNDTSWDEFLIEYESHAPFIPLESQPTQWLSFNRDYHLELTGKAAKIFILTVDMPAIYNFTLTVISGDMGFSLKNYLGDSVFKSDYMYADLVNPEQGNTEQIIHFLKPGISFVFINSLGNASGIFHATLTRTTEILYDQVVSGDFLPADGLNPPSAVAHYYSIYLDPGTYDIVVNTSWPVGLEVEIINHRNYYIVNHRYGIPGANFSYQHEMWEKRFLVIGIGSYTGTGSFSLIIVGHAVAIPKLTFIVVPFVLLVLITIRFRRKYNK